MAKRLEFSTDDITYLGVPSNTAELTANGETVNDSILGTTFDSQFTSLLNWEVSGDGIYKGVPGYQTCVLKQGTTTAATGEAMAVVTGLTYKVVDTSRDIWDAAVTPVVYDDVTDVTDEVESFDYLFGTFTFVGTYTPVGAITVDINYFPVAALGRFNSFTLTQSVTAVDDSDFQSLKANGGFRLNTQGLRTVSLEASGIYDAPSDFLQQLVDRDIFILEIQADGSAYSKARGYFQINTAAQSGAVGDNEVESISFSLNVPSTDYSPFGWEHDTLSTLSNALLIPLNAFNDETNIYVRYLPFGTGGAGGKVGQAIVTDISLTSSVDDMPRFTISLMGDDSLDNVV